jgi:NAD(P)-dependent dehydrogenase (short-subunit alcohol dehydrogenase family)
MNTVLVTGCSSGFGLDIAKHFLDQGWKVVATMRTPDPSVLPASDNLRILALDVQSDESVRQAVEAAGPIDVLVNNAGIGWLNALEGTPMDIARDIFETNTIGTMRTMQAVLPQFRERRSGTIVNVTSTVTVKPLPLLSVYTASKAAVNAFTASVAIELEPFGIRVRIVLPGFAPETSFGKNAFGRIEEKGGWPKAYADYIDAAVTQMRQHSGPFTKSTDVAEAVWRAATDPTCPMKLPAGADAVASADWAA